MKFWWRQTSMLAVAEWRDKFSGFELSSHLFMLAEAIGKRIREISFGTDRSVRGAYRIPTPNVS